MNHACPNTDQLQAMHDGELAPDAAAKLQTHLQTCPACAAELESMQRLTSLLQSARPRHFIAGEASAPDLAAIHAAVDRHPDPVIFRLALRLSSLAAAIVVACSVRLAIAEHSAAPMAVWESTAINLRSEDTAIPASFETWTAEDPSTGTRP